MNNKNTNEIITDKDYTIEGNKSNILQIRQIQSELYTFQKFRINDDDQSGFRKKAGNNLKAFCKTNSIIIGTDDRDYNKPIVSFLENSGFSMKFVKTLYQKN